MNTPVEPNMVRRSRCPACHGTRGETLREVPYADPLLRGYLDAFYREVGTVDHAALAGAVYCLVACADCGLVFQRDIPG
ncbi:MAG: hypothetical protein O3B24_11095, partial [Verrucomicrobia bacterium]|nr:hypothetical protein [Verrucomicrobiota bacterium]